MGNNEHNLFHIDSFITIFLSAAVGNIPSGSVILLIMVGSAINLPITDRLGLIMAVEWLL